MRAFADLLETTSAAGAGDAVRNLTTTSAVKTALKITSSDLDTLIDSLIPKASKAIVEYCRLARSAAGEVPTFARETLRATWHVDADCKSRGTEIWLPWRPPLASISSVVEADTALVANTDFVVMGNGRAVKLRRMSSDTPIEWSTGKIVVTWLAGFASTMSTNIEDDLEDAAIEQIRGLVFGADRDPAIMSENVPDLASVAYTVTGGSVMGASSILPAARDKLAPWRNPTP